ncbi:hypothetical protein BC835DRAFT_1310467 [Cytidiella melzeri]|nr:hypothetical protein BC835DRAFT_1310467 [Cytidiella melzeri]
MPLSNVNGRIVFSTQPNVFEEYACTALATLVFYDYFLTLNLELQNIWRRSLTLPTLIFMSNRYLCIALSFPLLLPIENKTIILGTLLSLVLALFFALRTYAIWNCKRAMFVLVLVAYIPGFSLNLCTMLLKDIPATRGIEKRLVSALVPAFYTFFDVVVLMLSLLGLWRASRSLGVNKLRAETISTFLLEHGILYFVLLATLNIPQIIMTNVLDQPLNAGVMLIFSSMLVSRFMLHLREATTIPHYILQPGSKPRRWSSISREMIIGNLGEPLSSRAFV